MILARQGFLKVVQGQLSLESTLKDVYTVLSGAQGCHGTMYYPDGTRYDQVDGTGPAFPLGQDTR